MTISSDYLDFLDWKISTSGPFTMGSTNLYEIYVLLKMMCGLLIISKHKIVHGDIGSLFAAYMHN